MIVRSYLEWSLTASNQERAEAVGILVDVFLEGDISDDERRDAEAALVLAANDTAPAVRRVLAQKLGANERAPRALIAALAQDLPDIAVTVIANSPLLSDAALVDLLALGDGLIQLAVAQRADVSIALAAAVAEVGSLEANLAMLENDGAEVPLFSLNRMLDRFGDEGALREALMARNDLPQEIRLQLVKCTADHLARFVQGCGWLPQMRAQRLNQESFETGVVAVMANAEDMSIASIVRRLRNSGTLTPQLLLRCLLCGDTRLLVVTLADLSGASDSKASAFVHSKGGMGFRALYRKAGLPLALEPVFEAALSAWHELKHREPLAGKLSRTMIERVLTSVALSETPELSRLTALLLRYHAEAVIDDAKVTVAAILAEPMPIVDQPDGFLAVPAPQASLDEIVVPDVVLEPVDLELRLADALDEEFRRAA
jgi:uncharacterized protein (DUF2336 family)